jgi:hypothetical protein
MNYLFWRRRAGFDVFDLASFFRRFALTLVFDFLTVGARWRLTARAITVASL